MDKLHAELQDLHNCMDNNYSKNLIEQKRKFQHKIEEAMIQEINYWKVKYKINWNRHGDHNTKFFQEKVNFRRYNNKIDALYSPLTRWSSNTNEISNQFVFYFNKIFKSSCPSLTPKLLS